MTTEVTPAKPGEDLIAIEDTQISIWQERGETQLTLIRTSDGATIYEWDTEAAEEDTRDGFLDGWNSMSSRLNNQSEIHRSAYNTAAERGALPAAEPEEEDEEPEITEETIEEYLRSYLAGEEDDDDTIPNAIQSANAYADTGLITYDRGILLKMSDGSEYQITIIQTRRPRDNSEE